ncbi:hypothetical protein TRAPUB_10257 [Trametes pubescens]|uniref:Uncharacterized protein n=1 Tax=Trametes pubescens TaxID=154538 RepID=A0A1M2W064_TRAPU|nr:hypothetical protein TRAPUB_10257 [Trametes pubescens]
MRPRADAPLLLPLLCAIAASPFARISASAALVNVTIDDTFGDESNGNQITYEPSTLWNVGQNCTGCTAHPDPALALKGTWHDSTYNDTQSNDPSVQNSTAAAQFEGTAVYVFCITTRSNVSPDGNSDMSFFIDGELVGEFIQPPNGSTAYEYNVPVYVNKSLPAGSHTIAIVNGQPGANKSLVLLDYIVYSHEVADAASSPSATPPPSSPQSVAASAPSSSTTQRPSLAANTGSVNSSQKRTIIIAVATVCGVLGLAAIISVVSWCCIRRRRNNYTPPSERDFIPRSPSHIEVNPATSGWAEGTWVEGQEDHPHSAASPTARSRGMLAPGPRKMSGRRKREAPNSHATSSTDPSSAPSTPARSPIVPPAILSAIPTFRTFSPSRADPPGSPASSSWGTPASMAPPDSATYLIAPYISPSTSNVTLHRAYHDGGSSTTLSSHNAHPFAKAHAVEAAPVARSRSGTTRSATGPSSSHPHPHPNPNPNPPPIPSAFTSHARHGGYPAEKGRRAGGSLDSSMTSPTTPPSAPYTLDTDESFLPSPSPADPSPLSSMQAMQSRAPERQPSQRQPPHPALQPSASQRRRRVDPVDPSMQPSRDTARADTRPLRVRGAGAHAQTQSDSSTTRSRPTGTTTFFQRDRRRRHGTVDVPVDAADSRPPSYRESG